MTDEDLAREMAEMEAPTLPAQGALERLTALAGEVNEIDRQLEELEKRVKVRKEKKYRILTNDMVDLMDEARVPFIGHGDKRFEVEEQFHASIPEPNRDKAHDWLEKNEAGDIIKYQVTATFGKDCHEEAARLRTYVIQNFQMAEVDMGRSVPWKRLTSWFKEQVLQMRTQPAEEEPKFIPMELLGAKVTRIVTVKPVKK